MIAIADAVLIFKDFFPEVINNGNYWFYISPEPGHDFYISTSNTSYGEGRLYYYYKDYTQLFIENEFELIIFLQNLKNNFAFMG